MPEDLLSQVPQALWWHQEGGLGRKQMAEGSVAGVPPDILHSHHSSSWCPMQQQRSETRGSTGTHGLCEHRCIPSLALGCWTQGQLKGSQLKGKAHGHLKELNLA